MEYLPAPTPSLGFQSFVCPCGCRPCGLSSTLSSKQTSICHGDVVADSQVGSAQAKKGCGRMVAADVRIKICRAKVTFGARLLGVSLHIYLGIRISQDPAVSQSPETPIQYVCCLQGVPIFSRRPLSIFPGPARRRLSGTWLEKEHVRGTNNKTTIYRCLQKTMKKKTHGNTSYQSTKPGIGEQFLLLDCTAKARIKGSPSCQTPAPS